MNDRSQGIKKMRVNDRPQGFEGEWGNYRSQGCEDEWGNYTGLRSVNVSGGTTYKGLRNVR